MSIFSGEHGRATAAAESGADGAAAGAVRAAGTPAGGRTAAHARETFPVAGGDRPPGRGPGPQVVPARNAAQRLPQGAQRVVTHRPQDPRELPLASFFQL